MLLFLLAYLAVRKRIARLVEGFIDIVSELLACLAQLFQELFAVLLGFARNSSNGFRFAFHKVFHTVANAVEKVKQCYSQTRVATQYIDIYKRAVAYSKNK